MKILIVGDKESRYIWDHFDRERFKDINLILSSGDLKPEYLSFLVTMIKAPLFYVHGNHDGRYIYKEPQGCTSIDNQLVVYNNIRILGLGGSQNYNNGNFQYTEKEMTLRIKKLKKALKKHHGFDILLTHAPAYGLGDGDDLCHRGFQAFVDLLDQYSPKYFIHGHQHLNYGRQTRFRTYKNTSIINSYEYYILEY
ncbi:metallophosphoesterase family protein [Defluviitalea raffinosedens]|jgi:Icc-related predicted phosphoesterase|uniref:Metallophosphoesterase n=1 Tax=Defluviitalea raffinosedens TaxID=1450156 RepID=A0A7C8LCZ1_9FIRM|nr:metallophosphoesterase [Defluviitalea raffinosedens]KAE9635017.1 metallophosphoesterase [Defluviitalea raffinosedens]MBM7686911.1 Icc-related predicted phosphoesterase [Defluviitalea raffinosedens]HHW67792.1 metallophosphoesterase [Candidatus Epulonipiscium sp.]